MKWFIYLILFYNINHSNSACYDPNRHILWSFSNRCNVPARSSEPQSPNGHFPENNIPRILFSRISMSTISPNFFHPQTCFPKKKVFKIWLIIFIHFQKLLYFEKLLYYMQFALNTLCSGQFRTAHTIPLLSSFFLRINPRLLWSNLHPSTKGQLHNQHLRALIKIF